MHFIHVKQGRSRPFIHYVLSASFLLFTLVPAKSQQLTDAIRLNQVGFYPQAPKVAVVTGEAGGTFYLTKPNQTKPVFTGQLGEVRNSEFSKKPSRMADFSAFTSTGTFVVYIPSLGYSYPFEIKPGVHQEVAKAVMKAFYYQRASTDLPAAYAGIWHRAAGHPDNQVLIHASAASEQRPVGTVISSPKGWYDAGDYNKYIVNSGITMGTLLSAYEDFPAYFKTVNLNLPESGNKVPDVLDEILWNLRWMLTMQDPGDGGVYNKLTNPSFDGMVMPAEAQKPRYVVQKGTAATLDFAAVMAQASRIVKPYSNELPGLSDSCLVAATKAWDWAKKNSTIVYDQEAINKQFEPKISTGGYGDRGFSDEFIWAAAELYVTTNKDTYYQAVNLFPDDRMPFPTWSQVRLLGYYTLARFEKSLSPIASKDLPGLKARLIQFADGLAEGASNRAYMTVMGKSVGDYIWGSSSVAANQGIALIQAYRLTSDKKYVQYALSNLDYLLGRNATGYSFITGYGEKSTMHPHHRPSIADDIKEPIPGFVSGGTNARAANQDHCDGYTTTFADEVYLDHDCSFASNEIAINWNAPVVYLAAAIEALQAKVGYSAENNPSK